MYQACTCFQYDLLDNHTFLVSKRDTSFRYCCQTLEGFGRFILANDAERVCWGEQFFVLDRPPICPFKNGSLLRMALSFRMSLCTVTCTGTPENLKYGNAITKSEVLVVLFSTVLAFMLLWYSVSLETTVQLSFYTKTSVERLIRANVAVVKYKFEMPNVW